MNDDELTELLSRAMHEQDRYAPSEREVRALARDLPKTPPHHRSWWPALLSAAVVLAVVGVSALWVPRLLSSSPEASGTPSPGGSPSIRTSPTPASRPVTVFMVDPGAVVGPGPRTKTWKLVPQQVTTSNSGNAAVDALRALFAHDGSFGLRNWLLPNGRPIVSVRDVRVTRDPSTQAQEVSVDLASPNGDFRENPYAGWKCPAGVACPGPEAMLQQIAWTVSTALRTSAPISLSVNGAPARQLFGLRVDQGGYPDPAAVASSHRDFSWYQEVCGQVVVTAVRDDGTSVPIDTPRQGPETSVLVLKPGQSAILDISGACFRHVTTAFDEEGVTVQQGDGSDHPRIVAPAPGTWHVTIAVTSSCNVGFDRATPCSGRPNTIAYFDLVVQE